MDLNIRYQNFEGWGTSLAWWANVVGGFPEPDRSNITRMFFDPVTGLGLNIVRYNIGGGENPAHLPPNSPVYLPFRTRVPGFEPSPGVYDWTQDANQRWVLQESSKLGVNIAEAFSNSPPWWMTNSGSVTGAVGAGDNLNPAYAEAFADYLTTVAEHFHQEWGITFRTLEAFNEPNTTYWHFGGGQEGCGFAPATQNAFIKVLAASMAAKNMNYTAISASDETSVGNALSSLSLYDSTSIGYVSQFNTHTYGGNATQLQNYHIQTNQLNKRMWISEYGDSAASGLTMASRIITDLRNGQPHAWVYWQTVDSASGWGFIRNPLQDEVNTSYVVNQKFYVMGNFSRFIHPGYQFVGMTDGSSVAAYDGLGTLVIVTLNNGTSERNLTYTLQNLPDGPWSATPYQTSSTQNLAMLSSFDISGNQFAATLPAQSVTTFVITNGRSSPLISGKTYKIMNANSGLVMTVPDTTMDGQQVIQKADMDQDNQKWVATAAGSYWVLTNVASGLALNVKHFSTHSGTPVDQANVTHYKNQVWNVTADGTGNYRIINQNSGLYLDVTGRSVSEGGKVFQSAPIDQASQSWTFQVVP
ncbi:MAG: RICIN domain-containing protein [Blastocatellia bacterium]|nr:RICIN domain-containing protein [Blastocatellia bacterium]